ncbi:MAG: DUF2188 domain-containing protein [Lentisphaerae bacterium]|nr:DUF2188 domain-containing protein [Lentisphaerota bacterium]
MVSKRSYEIVFDRFHKRWVFKPQGLPGALQVAGTRDEVIERAIPICNNNQPCTLKVHREDGQFEEELAFGKDARPSKR